MILTYLFKNSKLIFKFRKRKYNEENEIEHENWRKGSNNWYQHQNHWGNMSHHYNKRNSRGSYDNFRPRTFRKRTYYNRNNNYYKHQRKYYNQKFNSKFSFHPKHFDYQGEKQGGFKAPRRLTTYQQKKRHLKMLRKTAAEVGSKNPAAFVYKPGMIGLLRPDTPRNTNEFLMSHKKNQQKKDPFAEFNSKHERDCYSEVNEKLNMTQHLRENGVRTPDPKRSPLSLGPIDPVWNPSHYSDVEEFYEQFEEVSGTMEGLVNADMFDNDPPLRKNSVSKEENKYIEQNAEEEKGLEEQEADDEDMVE